MNFTQPDGHTTAAFVQLKPEPRPITCQNTWPSPRPAAVQAAIAAGGDVLAGYVNVPGTDTWLDLVTGKPEQGEN
jgi:hypothetical protein